MDRAMVIAEIGDLRECSYSRYLTLNPLLPGSAGVSASIGSLEGLKERINQLPDRLRFWRWKSSSSYDEELRYNEVYEAALETCHLAKATGTFVPALDKLSQEDAAFTRLHPEATNHFLFFDQSDPWTEKYLLRLARAETARRLTVTAIALKRYHLEHGIYPATLNELVPAFLFAVPIDFMDGKPLRYKLRPDGDFLLYSVGEDGKDDGGDPSPVPPSTSFNWMLGRDIVWPRVATPAALEEYRQHSQTTTNASGNRSN